MKVEQVAMLCHEANKLLCEQQRDFSQVPWEFAPEDLKESARAGVRFHLANPDATPAESHASWLEYKASQGWKYGEWKDTLRKLHPNMVPYTQLSAEQQMKDHLFRGIVHALRRFVED